MAKEVDLKIRDKLTGEKLDLTITTDGIALASPWYYLEKSLLVYLEKPIIKRLFEEENIKIDSLLALYKGKDEAEFIEGIKDNLKEIVLRIEDEGDLILKPLTEEEKTLLRVAKWKLYGELERSIPLHELDEKLEKLSETVKEFGNKEELKQQVKRLEMLYKKVLLPRLVVFYSTKAKPETIVINAPLEKEYFLPHSLQRLKILLVKERFDIRVKQL